VKKLTFAEQAKVIHELVAAVQRSKTVSQASRDAALAALKHGARFAADEGAPRLYNALHSECLLAVCFSRLRETEPGNSFPGAGCAETLLGGFRKIDSPCGPDCGRSG
jgi:hypothetical protein